LSNQGPFLFYKIVHYLFHASIQFQNLHLALIYTAINLTPDKSLILRLLSKNKMTRLN